MILFPYKTDSLLKKPPIVNLIFTLVLLAASLLFYFGKLNIFLVDSILNTQWTFIKAFGMVLIQPDLITIFFISLFFLLLGNSINSIIGNFYYLLLIISFCIITSLVHSLLSPIPAIGAHGVISALAGSALMLLPSNKIIIYKPDLEEETGISIASIILFWILFDLYSIIKYPSIITLLAHLAGLFSGIFLAYLLYKSKLIISYDPVISEWFNDKVALLSGSEMISSILPGSRKTTKDAEIKLKAEKLMELLDTPFNTIEEKTETNSISPEEEPAVKFRLLKPVKQKDYITLYFVYEGEEISDITIHSENYKCEIYPSELLKYGGSGSIKIYSKNIDQIDLIYLLIKYNLKGAQSDKRIIYSILLNELRS